MAQHKIDNTKATLMMTVALTFDGIQALVSLLHFIPVLGSILAFLFTSMIMLFAFLTFWFWFALNGIFVFNNTKNVAALATAVIIESIPLIKVLPSLSFWVFRVITISRVKEKLPVKTRGERLRRFAKSRLRNAV